MVFSGITFIFYLLPLFLIIDSALRWGNQCAWRNIGLIFVSLLFYTWGEGGNVLLLLIMALVNHAWGRAVDKFPNRAVLAAGIALNLLLLFKYKYFYWIHSLIFNEVAPPPQTVMPLGISFFTFHAISYLVDVYRKDIKPARLSVDFFAYFCMFPHLVAGPIVRYAQVREQISRRGPDRQLFDFGVYRFLLGLNKKVIIANSVSVVADAAFSSSAFGHGLGMMDAWIGIAAYTVQIYFDFSAYSDMAIGLAAMAGFRFEENFRRPYSSASIKEFWRRWHISLSNWFRDYLYIPLGGNRKGNIVSFRNLIIVFFLCGLWHGANLTFVIWGLWHGGFLVFERIKAVEGMLDKIPIALKRLYALLVVMLGWVFFRADTPADAGSYFASLFSLDFSEVTLSFHALGCWVLALAIVLCLIPDRWLPQPTAHAPQRFKASAFMLQTLLAVVSISMLLASSRNPFIYFNF